jgi:hypothetical protein
MVNPVAGVVMVPRDELVMDEEIVVAVAVASNPSHREAFTRRINSLLGRL